MTPAKFEFASNSYDLQVSVDCSMRNENDYPNQCDLRKALDELILALELWDNVSVTIENVRREGE